MRVLDVLAQLGGNLAQLTLLLVRGVQFIDGVFHLARVQPCGCQARIGVHKAGQHPAHILAVACNALAVNKALERAVVVLGQFQELLECLILRIVACSVQPQHRAKQFCGFGGNPRKQLVLLVIERALRHAGVLIIPLHGFSHAVAIGLALKHAKVDALAVSIHHIHGVLAKALQGHVAVLHQLLGLVVRSADLEHLGRHLVAAVRNGLGALLQLVVQQLPGVRQRGRIHHHVAEPVPVPAQGAQHFRAGSNVQRLVHRGARLVVQADLLLIHAEEITQLFVIKSHASL